LPKSEIKKLLETKLADAKQTLQIERQQRLGAAKHGI
jgi:hypothetical protein